ncbi:hypothetical protein, partial [Stomatohabitans albus]|uniref:hypothetical protein n=1 Tax=Stomatohabitans albus TaxID=3110766 RepID=UPI003AB9BAF9
MNITNLLVSGFALASLSLTGMPMPGYAQAVPPPHQTSPAGTPVANTPAVPNKDNLVISLDDTEPTTLLGEESVIKGKITNNSASPQYNVGWSVLLPEGVDFLGATAGPAEYGSPKATILLYPDHTETVVHWANAVDISPGEEIWFEIRVNNKGPKKGSAAPGPSSGTVYKIDDTFTVKAWAQGSTQASALPTFAEYGYGGQSDPGGASSPWSVDAQPVMVKGLDAKLTIEEQLNGITVRGNKANQRQMVTVELKRTGAGDLELTDTVDVELDPTWEVMGTCVKNGENCFTPTEQDLEWVTSPQPHWVLHIPAAKFNFDSENMAKVTFEVAALDKKNVAPGNTPKVNQAGLGGDGNQGGTRNDVAYLDPAYANNTGDSTHNQVVTFKGTGTARYIHPWNGEDATKYPNVGRVKTDIPDLVTTVQDTSVSLTTSMVDGGAYKNNELANKKLVVRANEYAPLSDDRTIKLTLSEPECPVAKGTTDCVANGQSITLTRTVTTDSGPTTSEVTGTVSKGPDNKFVITIPAAGIDPRTSITQTFEFQSKVLDTANGKPVVNGKPLVTKATLSWTDNATPIKVDAEAELPPALIEIFNTVAFPNPDGTCPAPTSAMPTAEERKNIAKQPENNRLFDQLNGATDIWGKRRKIGNGKDLCFQVLMKYPDGIETQDPKLNLFLPSEAQLVGTPDSNITYAGSLSGQQQFVAASNVPSAVSPVDKPDKRTPLTYTFGQRVAGGSLLSMVYKATIKNSKVPEADQPVVLYDNLAKLGYTDFDGGFSNARDLAGYEFINPILMLKVDKALVGNANRGSTQRLTYTVTNIGDSPAAPGTKVALKLPESFTCANVTVGGGATQAECVSGPKAGHDPKLISGDYLLVNVTDGIGSRDPNSATDEKTFTLDVAVPNNHSPSLSYEVEAGIVGYTSVVGSGQEASTYMPKMNAFCKPVGSNLDEAAREAANNACVEEIGKAAYGLADASTRIGKSLFAGPNAATGGLSTLATSIIETNKPAISLTGTSSDTNNPDLTVVPGEKGSVSVIITPNVSDSPGTSPALLDGPQFSGNDAFIALVFRGTGLNQPNYFKTENDIKATIVAALGEDMIYKDQIVFTPTNDSVSVRIPLKKIPGQVKTMNFSEVFVGTGSEVRVQASTNYKAGKLVHTDKGQPKLNQPATGDLIAVPATQVVFASQEPALTVNKQVTSPATNRIIGKSTIDYTVTITNTGKVPAYGVNVTDTLPQAFTHAASLTQVTATGVTITNLDTKKAWTLSDGNRKGVWPPNNETFMMPAGSSITMTYTATAPPYVTTALAYTNNVAVPFASQPGNPVGVKTYDGNGSATVHGDNISSTTTITAKNPGYHPNGKVQHGELVKTVTTISIPKDLEVPNLSVLTELAGANIDRSNAKVTVTCPSASGLACDNATLLGGDANKLGVVVKDGTFQNNTNGPIEIVVEVTDLLVTGGDGPITATGNAYRGNTKPTDATGFDTMEKSSDGSTGRVEVLNPSVALDATFMVGNTPLTTPIEPGTEDLHLNLVIKNPVADSVLRNTVVTEIKDKLAASGLKVAASFTDPKWDGEKLTIGDLEGGDTNTITVKLPIEWDPAKFSGSNRLTDRQVVTIPASGQTGPLNAVQTAQAPETEGTTPNTTANPALTPLFPIPSVTVKLSDKNNTPLREMPIPILNVGDEGFITITPNVDGGHPYNPLVCLKITKTRDPGAPSALAKPTLYQPAAGVTIATPNTICDPEDIEINLPTPQPGEKLPSVKLTMNTSGIPNDILDSVTIRADLKVDSRIDGGNGTPGQRSFRANDDKEVLISPAVDLKVAVDWSKQPTSADDGVSNYNDYDNEQDPIFASISITNVGRDEVNPTNARVKLNIPDGWDVEPPTNPQGWTCEAKDEGGKRVLECTRTTNLPANQTTPFIVKVVSPTGAQHRLTNTPLMIMGAFADNRAITSNFDANDTNDKVDTQATVFVPLPDLSTTVTVPSPILTDNDLTKPFTVKVKHDGDKVRASEATVTISAANGNGAITITNANGWTCQDFGQNQVFVCDWPHASPGGGNMLPTIEATVTVPTKETDVTVEGRSGWLRIDASGIRSGVPDKNPANDRNVVPLKPFDQWVDGKVTITFDNPNPRPGEDPGPKVQIIHNDGGANIPVGTTIRLTVPPGATVTDTPGFNNCRKPDPSQDVWECNVATAIPPGQTVDGPGIAGVDGPNKTITVTIVLDNDPNQGNNTATGSTRNNTPVPGPVDPIKPSPDPTDNPTPEPTPDPGERPSEIPPAPAPPARPAPVNPGTTSTINTPEERSDKWVESVFPANATSRIVLIGRDNVFADSLSSGGLQGMLDA